MRFEGMMLIDTLVNYEMEWDEVVNYRATRVTGAKAPRAGHRKDSLIPISWWKAMFELDSTQDP